MPTITSKPPPESRIDAALTKKNVPSPIFQRRIVFKEFTQPDREFEALKMKYRPINEIPGTTYEQKPQQLSANVLGNDSGNPLEDENGFRRPSRMLFDKNRLSPTWQEVRPVGPGLVNLSNTCFLNSVMQCLAYTPPLANFLLSGEHGESCKSTDNCMLCELEKHVMRTFSGEKGSAFCPRNIIGRLKQIARHMRYGRQEDSHEFMRHLLDAVANSALAGYDSKMDHRIKETTVIHQIFGGYLQSQIKCMQCQRESNTFDPMLDVSLDVKNVSTVDQAFKGFTKPELLTKANRYRCEGKCQGLVDARKQLTIYHAPLVLTVHLKRFMFGGGMGGGKINKHIEFRETLDLREYVSHNQKSSVDLYRLYAVLVHAGGSCNSGHYYCFVKSTNGAWYNMNDSSVTRVSMTTVLQQRAYMLFYAQESVNGSRRQVAAQTVKRELEEAKQNLQLQAPKRFKSDENGTDEEVDRKAQTQGQTRGQAQGVKRKSDAIANSENRANGFVREQNVKRVKIESGEVGEVVDRRTFAKEKPQANRYANAPPVVNRHKPPVVTANKERGQTLATAANKERGQTPTTSPVDAVKERGQIPTKSPVVAANKERGQTQTKSPAVAANKEKGQTLTKSLATSKSTVAEADRKDITSTTTSRANKLNSLLPTPSPSPSVDGACAVPAPTTVGADKWVVTPLALSRQSLHGSQSPPTYSSVLNSEDRWTIKSKGEEKLTPPPVEELRKISGKAKEKGNVAIVVNYNDKMESKRAKLDELLEREAAYEKSLEVKDRILGVGMPKGQFGGSVDRWDGSSTDASRAVALRQTSAPKKRQSQYDAEYDRGKVKKMKKSKQWQIENKFQAESDLQNALKSSSRGLNDIPR
ncbi:hypothetical protein BC936DRAFT_142635 [Jimgerdemannia flammicorona]|uniref:ubiquitinyl hydrolase 1 n=1 Tax=Jimgerdemannia flammicorona TaxID=994334 RepID=A0A433DEZ6_9FUNG|nr:hypothetical protein BC936DRAFT_142635 [Jimgerdemannia flammicorona]